MTTLLTGCKTRQAIGVHVDAQRIDGRNENVQTQIELAAVDQQRTLNVSGNMRMEFRLAQIKILIQFVA